MKNPYFSYKIDPDSFRSQRAIANHQKEPNRQPSRGSSAANRLGALPAMASSNLLTALFKATIGFI